MKARILWIEGKRAEGPHFIPGLRKEGYQVETVQTGDEALTLLSTLADLRHSFILKSQLLDKEVLTRLWLLNPGLVVVNAASMRSSGKRICRALRKDSSTLPIVVIANPDPNPAFEPDSCASVHLALPFTLRKLINRIEQLLPWDGESVYIVGPICLDETHRRVRTQDREARLTPRLTHLLKLLMQHPGEVIERERLFREVWKTEYTEDTRALDVHISWLRDAIEENPRQPRYLKTIRGVGYRLDL